MPSRITGVALLALALVSVAQAHPLLEPRLDRLTRLIESEPGDAALWLERGDLYRLDRLWELALADYVRARELDPGLDGLDFSLGWLYLETGRNEKALLHLDRFLGRHPGQPVALLGRARALAALGRRDEVGDAYGRAVDALGRPQPDHYLEWSRTLADGGEPALALAVLDAGLARLGEIGSLLRAAVDVEAARGELEAAVVRLDRLLASTPRPEEALLRKAEILERMGRIDDARAALRLALETLEARPPSRREVTSFRELEVELRAALERLDSTR